MGFDKYKDQMAKKRLQDPRFVVGKRDYAQPIKLGKDPDEKVRTRAFLITRLFPFSPFFVCARVEYVYVSKYK
jgi:hypothetical protein